MQGVVAWFNDEKGFGFVKPRDGSKDVFVHFSGIEGTGRRSLEQGAKVEFDIEQDDKGLKAVNVQVIDAFDEGTDRAGTSS